MFFDSHAHYDDRQFNEDRDSLLSNMKNMGVGYILNAASDIKSSRFSLKLARQYDFIYAAVGVHPHEVAHLVDEDINIIRELSRGEKCVAIGEIGLDYYYDHSPRDMQRLWFKKQLELAKELNLPYIVHEREACLDCLTILDEVGYFNGVMHCFSGSLETAKTLIKKGMYISLGGPVTFKNARHSVEVAGNIPLEKLLIETDSPYLAPVPVRGKRNDSSNLKYIAQKIAEIRGVDVSVIENATMENAKRFFGIS
ncbi:MAG: TatD family hydrolase [Clostridiaceae bacterium]|nr:TatD family hydrolase [Clostridiaceae bacterium]